MTANVASPLMPRVLVVGPYPPPVQGAALVTQLLVDVMRQTATVELVIISPDGLQRDFSYFLQRVLRVGRACMRLAAFRYAGERAFYLVCAGGHGTLYDLILVAIARLIGVRVHLHHHAFSYISHRPPLSRLLIRVAGAQTLHICLCRRMAERLAAQYRSVHRTVVLSNAALVTPGVAHAPGTVLRLGFMSNLMASKGLDRTIEVMRRVRQSRPAVKLIVAGPAVDRSGAALVVAAQHEFTDSFEYRGPVYGADKDAFFSSIDVFLFPSRYVNEAQPLVVLEALAYGIPVVANNLGCIGDDVSSEGGIVAPSDNEFVALAAAAITRWIDDRAALAQASQQAMARSWHLHRAARDDLVKVVQLISQPEPLPQ